MYVHDVGGIGGGAVRGRGETEGRGGCAAQGADRQRPGGRGSQEGEEGWRCREIHRYIDIDLCWRSREPRRRRRLAM